MLSFKKSSRVLFWNISAIWMPFFKKLSDSLKLEVKCSFQKFTQQGHSGSLAYFFNEKGEKIKLSSAHREEEILDAAKSKGLKLNVKRSVEGNEDLISLNAMEEIFGYSHDSIMVFQK